MRARPSDATSRTRTAPPAVATSKPFGPIPVTVPGAADVTGATVAARIFSRRPSRRVSAPGLGAKARIRPSTEAAGSSHRILRSSAVSLGGDGGGRRVLGHRDGRTGGEGRDRVGEERAAELGQTGAERAGVFVLADAGRHLLEDRAGVEALVHQHRGDAGIGVAGQQRVLDGRRAAPSRQQGQVQVHGAEAAPRRGHRA